jgi:hypothetical protein
VTDSEVCTTCGHPVDNHDLRAADGDCSDCRAWASEAKVTHDPDDEIGVCPACADEGGTEAWPAEINAHQAYEIARQLLLVETEDENPDAITLLDYLQNAAEAKPADEDEEGVYCWCGHSVVPVTQS